MPIIVTCEGCGKKFSVKPSRLKRSKVRFCSIKCREKIQYTGRFVRVDGYVIIKVDKEYKLEHRYILEQHLNRKLLQSEHVHHINENKADNRLENLELLDIAEHTIKHHKGIDESTWQNVNCLYCGKVFKRRKKETKRHPKCFCSRKCYLLGCNR